MNIDTLENFLNTNPFTIGNYTIRYDDIGMIIDVNGNVLLDSLNLTELPFRFGVVTGGFFCHNNNLTSLYGSPEIVGGEFVCYCNKLTSLEHTPHKIGGEFDFSANPIRSFEFCPNKFDNPNITLTSDYHYEEKSYEVLFELGYDVEDIDLCIVNTFGSQKVDITLLKRQWTLKQII